MTRRERRPVGARATSPGASSARADRPALATADGRLVLDAVTPPGRRPMSGADWLRGRRAVRADPRVSIDGDDRSPDAESAAPLGLRLDPSATAPRDRDPASAASTPEALAAWFVERGQPALPGPPGRSTPSGRGRETAFDEILTLPAALRDELEAAFRFDTVADRGDPRRPTAA